MALLDDAAATARSVPRLAVLSVVSTFLAFEKVVETASAGPGGGAKFPLPAALPDLWTVVSVPSTGVEFQAGVPLPLFPVFLVVGAALAAGYLGRIDAAIADADRSFTDAVAAYTVPVLLVQVVTFALSVLVFVPALAGGLVFAPFAALGAIAVGYLTWAAPYLVVAREYGAADALAASARHALSSGRYAGFSVAYLVAGVVASFVLSAVTRGSLLAVVGAAILVAYPLLVASAAAMLVVRSLEEKNR